MTMDACSVGRVLESRCQGFQTGDRVVSMAPTQSGTRRRCNNARITADETAAFTVLGAIALRGVRLVLGLGDLSYLDSGRGLLTVQILRANGCQVIALDFDSEKLALARSYGAEVVDRQCLIGSQL